MNLGVVGLLLLALSVGIIVAACWRFGTSGVARWTPALLAGAYYAASFVWPHPAVVAARRGLTYPSGDETRLMLLGVTLVIGTGELVWRLNRAVTNNRALRAELARLKGGDP